MTAAPKAESTKARRKKVEKSLDTLNERRIRTRVVPVAELLPADYNPRKITAHALEGLQASIREFGYVEPIVWNEGTGKVVGGHQRLAALAATGTTHIEVVVVDLDEAREQALNVTLNNPAIQGTWDDEKLQQILAGLQAEVDDGTFASSFFADVRLDELAATFDSLDFDMGGKGDTPPPEGEGTGGGGDETPPYSVQLTLMVPHQEYEGFITNLAALQKRWGCDQTAAVMHAVAGHIASE